MKTVLLLIVSIFIIPYGFAQETPDVLKMLVQKELITQEEADSLIRESARETKKTSVLQQTKSAFESEAFRLSGYGQVIYTATEHPGSRAQVSTRTHNNIEVARVILFAVGKLGYKNQFGYMLMYDLGPNAKLHELYGEWLPAGEFNLRIGQSKIPFTIENPMSPTRIETIYFSRSASAMSGSAGDFNQYEPDGVTIDAVKAGRDAGIQVYGKVAPFKNQHCFEYYAGLYNGTGFNTRDNNNHKDFVGSLYYSPLKGLKMGGSVYSGKLYGTINGVLSNHVRNRWAAGAEYAGSNVYSRAEYIEANDGGLRRCGGYASAVWKIVPDKWEVLCKYDYYNDNKAGVGNEIADYTAGINYYFAYLSRLQLNYIYTDNKAQGSNNMIAAQLQVFF